MEKIGLLPRLIIGLVTGIIIGLVCSLADVEWPVRLLATFNGVFGSFLGYIIPFIIIGFVAYGIADLGTGAGKLLALTTGIAYLSTITAGILAFFTGALLLSGIAVGGGTATNPEHALLTAFIEVEIPPVMGVMTALVTAFLLGLGIAATGSRTMLAFMKEFEAIIGKTIRVIIIPLLPIHIGGIFANMTFAGQVWSTMAVFGQVFAIIIALHIAYIVLQYTAAGSIAGKNPVVALRNMLPAYVTAIGTQSSAATIPVTLRSAKKNVSEDVADFAIPLCATIHLAGSTITITMCAMAVMFMAGTTPTFGAMLPFILTLGVTMIAAPGVPGGAVMASLALLSSMLGFNDAQLALMIALYLTQDSFGTAANVMGDGAIAMVVDRFAKTRTAAPAPEAADPVLPPAE
jgi:Na+/H+-dicarboxylate symporter